MMLFKDADKNIVGYDGSPVSIRLSAYAVVINEAQVLIVKNRSEKLFDIPGGGVEIGETIQEALIREAVEEAGAVIAPRELIYIHESYFYSRKTNKYFQSVQLFFRADLVGKLGTPTEEDNIENKFVDLVDLDKYPLSEEVLVAIRRIIDPLSLA